MRSTVRMRFTAMYGGLFLLSGAVLLIIAVAVAGGVRVSATAPVPGRPPGGDLAQAHARIAELEAQVADAHADATRALLIGSLVALAVMAVVSFALGRIVTGRVLRPLRTMTASTRRITADRLHERLAMPGPADEVKDLADTIDELLERLEGAFAAQRRFVANASHELRTPLTTMRASLDVAVAKPAVPPATTALAGRLGAELDQMEHLLDALLALARTGADAADGPPDPTDVAVADLVADALAARAGDAESRGITITVANPAVEAHIRGSRALLRRMLDNLIDNAITHNEHDGWIHVAVTAAPQAAPHTPFGVPAPPSDDPARPAEPDDAAGARRPSGVVRLTVETGGPVLDQRQVARLAQPFRRLAADRTGAGAGLGLSIVAAVATAHGGTLALSARADGGLSAAVTLPLTVPAEATR